MTALITVNGIENYDFTEVKDLFFSVEYVLWNCCSVFILFFKSSFTRCQNSGGVSSQGEKHYGTGQVVNSKTLMHSEGKQFVLFLQSLHDFRNWIHSTHKDRKPWTYILNITQNPMQSTFCTSVRHRRKSLHEIVRSWISEGRGWGLPSLTHRHRNQSSFIAPFVSASIYRANQG